MALSIRVNAAPRKRRHVATWVLLLGFLGLSTGQLPAAGPRAVGWGSNARGQASPPPDLSKVAAISAGYEHNLILTNDGIVFAWGGQNGSGQYNSPLDLTGVIAVAIGSNHSLALKNNGTVVAWGGNNRGQANVPAGLTGVIAIAAGQEYSLALKNDGTVVAWGRNDLGQLNVPVDLTGVIAISTGFNHSLALKSDGSVVAWGYGGNGETTVPAGLNSVIAIAAGGAHSLAVKSDGSVVAWGLNNANQTLVPAGLTDVVAVAAGSNHSLALRDDGAVVGWGSNGSGQATVPAGLTDVVAVAAGAFHSLALKSDGAIVAWGAYNSGSGTTQGRVPAYLTEPVQAIAAGEGHSLALQADGTVIAWGSNERGQIDVPPDLTGVIAVSGGGQHSMALKSDGTVVAWGQNSGGQATAPPGLTGVIAISAGRYHSLALKSDGTVAAWGENAFGQGSFPPGLADVTAISAGPFYNLVLKENGTVAAWGANSWGQTTVPAGLTNVIAIAAGGDHCLALKSNGTVVAWGRNIEGQSNVPAGLNNVVAIAVGVNHSLALKNDGSIVAWGSNSHGQGTVPAGLTGVTAIAAGWDQNLAIIGKFLEQFEAASANLGAVEAGFEDNNALDTLSINASTHFQLVDLVDDSPGTGPECVYAHAVIVPANSTLDLNGLKLYARHTLIQGQVINGTVRQLAASSSPIPWNTATPGNIAEAGALGEWTFFAHAGKVLTIVADTGGDAVASPALGYVRVSLVNAEGQTIAAAENTEAGQTVLLANLAVPAAGVYKIHVHAASAQITATGNYRVTVWDTALDFQPLILNQQHLGHIGTPYDVDHWTFWGNANHQVQFDLINASAAGASFTLRGPGDWVGFAALSSDSDPISLPATGSYTLTATGTGASTQLAYAFRLQEMQPAPLAVNTPHHGQFDGSGEAFLFQLEVLEGGPLHLVLQNSGTGNHTEIYASRSSSPTRTNHELASSSGPGANRNLFIPYAPSGSVWYFLVYAGQVAVPGAFTLEARMTSIMLSALPTTSQAFNTPASLTILGAGFQQGAVVELVADTGEVYAATEVQVDAYDRLTASFSANAAPAGVYSVRVTLPGGASATLANAFTFLSAGSPKLETKLILPSSLGRHAVATIYVEYANTGTAPMPAPVLILKSADLDGSDQPILTLDQNRTIENFWSGVEGLPPGTSHEVLILASGAQPGLLNPGERFTVPVYYSGLLMPWNFADNQVELEIRYWTEADTGAINWAERKESLRPPTLDAAIWDVVFANLTSGLATTGDYVAMLNDNARYLGRLGLRLVDVGELWDFEVQQAYGYSALPILESVTDISVPAPGLPLDLPRTFASNLRSRNASSGPFGRGWSTPWQIKLAIERNGALIKLINDDGSASVYARDIRNSFSPYFSGAGDSSQLLQTGGFYQLNQPNGNFTRFRGDGLVDFVQDANGNRITATWNGAGQLTVLTHTSGASITLSYGGNGFVSQILASTGQSVSYTYNGSHLATATTDDGKETSYTYDTSGPAAKRHALTSITRASVTRHFIWDERGRLASTHLVEDEAALNFNYGSAGDVAITQAGATTHLFFEHRGLLAKTIDPFGYVTTSEYGKDLRLKRLLFPSGKNRSYTWCACGSPTSITDELGHTTRFKYDHPLKRRTQFIDARGNVTHFNYNAKGNLLSTVYPDDSTETLADYTSAGLPLTQTNRRGQAIALTYTPAGQVQRKTFPDGSYDDFEYDTRGNLIQVIQHPVSGTDRITTYHYNHAQDGNRLKKVNYSDSKWVEYLYDAAGRRIQLTDSAGGETRYEYDSAGRLSKLRDGAEALLAEYLYDEAGRIARLNKGNGTYTTYEYDLAGRLLHLVNHAPNGDPNSRFDYTYDSLGNRASLETLDGKWTYKYDAAGQLVKAAFDSENPEIPDQDLNYRYDALGNRVSTILNNITTEYLPNELNQYDSIGGTPHAYDADGNLVSDGVRTYAYDLHNRLIQVTGPEGVTEYEYDAFGNRIATVHDGERTEYLLDPSGLTHVVAEHSEQENMTIHNVYGAGLISRLRDGEHPYYFDFDAIGSTSGLTTTGGAVSNQYAYDPFGGALQANESVPNPLQFIGQSGVRQERTGMFYMRERFLSKNSGAFASIDPIKLRGGLNYYNYAKNDPISLIDPSGLSSDGDYGVVDFGPPGGEGCGSDGNSQWVPDRIGVADISPACDKHDNCYDTCGVTQASCDAAFFLDVLHATGSLSISSVYAGAVSFFGKDAFEQAQKKCKPKPPPPDKPPIPSPGNPGTKGDSDTVTSIDPNEKIGPGFGPQGWVKADALLPYRINFENIGPGSVDANGDPYPTFATAPAQRVTISDPLAATLDWDSFQITEFGFGDIIVHVPGGASHYAGSVPVTFGEESFVVEIQAGIDFSTGLVSVSFQALNPETGLPPPVLFGVLPPEDGTGIGMGHFSYTVRSKASLPANTEIRNVAFIRFDHNEIIATNQVDPQDASKGIDTDKEALITLDTTPPVSAMQPLPPQSGQTFAVSWNGSDADSGLRQFHLYVSENDGPFLLWISTTQTTVVFEGVEGTTYGFLCLAEDNAGHIEDKPAAPETSTTVSRLPSTTLSVAMPFHFVFGSGFTIIKITGLPPGLVFNKAAGTIQGKPKKAGTFIATAHILGEDGKITKEPFTIVVDPLPGQALGSYLALIERNPVIGSSLGGALTLKTTSAGAASGKVTVAGKSHALRGELTVLAADLVSLQTSISRGKKLPSWNLALDFATDDTVSGFVTENAQPRADLAGWRAVWRKKTQALPAIEVAAEQSGRFNVLLDLAGPPWRGDAGLPQGLGHVSFTVSKLGAIRFTGKLSDGASLTLSSTLGPQGEAAFWAPLYKNTGSAILHGAVGAAGEVAGDADWVRLPQKPKERLYREGFGHAATATLPEGPAPLNFAGGRWIAPVKVPVLGLPYDLGNPVPNALLSLTGGGIETDTATATPDVAFVITDRNKALPQEPNPAKLKLSITASTGLASGSFLLQDVGGNGKNVKRTVKFQSLLTPGLEETILGGGHFLLPQLADPTRTLSGRVLLIEAEE